jgi:hypothetical protein
MAVWRTHHDCDRNAVFRLLRRGPEEMTQAIDTDAVPSSSGKASHARLLILALVTVATLINYLDRSVLIAACWALPRP